jgi:succinate-semialdehyde dehydrogenase / glutarate-semialdehyde dehydrogenase
MSAVNLRPDACLIDGQWCTGELWREVRNPADGSLIARVPAMGQTETRNAITAAEAALPKWAGLAAAERTDVLNRFHALILSHERELARILTAEQGKSLTEALAEIRYAASFVAWFAAEAMRVYGETIPATRADHRIMVLKQPIGVVAAITPWNFPAAMITRKLAPALAAGCTTVIKPAEQTPLTAFALGALAQAAGMPAGVVNIVTGDPQAIGAELTANPVIRKLSFTGSTRTGALLYAQCAQTVKKLSLELGGNAPFIVFDDADIDEAVKGAVIAKFRNGGQTCVCANRIYVQTGIHDRFIDAFTKAVNALKVGPGEMPDTDIGPLIDDAAVAKVTALIDDAVTKGARPATATTPTVGRFVNPVVLVDVQSSMRLMNEEIFGPVAPVMRFDREDEVIRLANAAPDGLASYVYTRDLARALRMAEALEAGMVGINTGAMSTAVAPFGGIKTSGLGREGSRHGLDDYLELKTVTMALYE